MEHPSVTTATPAMRTRVVETVVAAFDADPAFRYFFPDEAEFQAHAATFTARLFDERVARGTVWVIEDGAAVAMWDGPYEVSVEPVAVSPTASDLPPDVVERLARYDAAVDTALPAAPHWYLGVVATHPAYAGQGWGRRLIATGVRRAVDTGLPAYLETTNARNVELYRSVGWEVTSSPAVPGLNIWVMRHPAGAVHQGA